MLNGAKQRQLEVACAECGLAVGVHHAFCPHCGTKTVRASAHQDTAVLDDLGTLFAGEPEPAEAPSDLAPEDATGTRPPGGADALPCSPDHWRSMLVLGSAGVWGWSFFRDAPARSALDETQVPFAAAVTELSGAASLDELHDSASTLDAMEGELEAARRVSRVAVT